jgi:predicted alpha/beta hydrolase family esterase
MKRAAILHGTGANPRANWFPWLKAKLEAVGYDVWVPQLPDCDKPNLQTYGNFLLGGEWDFSDTIVIGHSSGAVEVLNLLMDQRCPQIRFGVLVGAWANGMPNGYTDETIFANTFPPTGFDFDLIKSKASRLGFLHGSDDPYCPIEQAEYLAKQLEASFTVIQDGHHLGAKFSELPELWQIIEPNL